jgi:exopolyphosphatase/guanosine-5'-triphosphate,3'-diphosphate pyrophosphatase
MRFAAIDVGTNSVLLLVAERMENGQFSPVVERAEITRLGRGVDATGLLSKEGMDETLGAIERFVAEARALGVVDLAVTATSAARDAKNGADFLAAAKQRARVTVEIITGDAEAQLSFAAVLSEFGPKLAGRGLVVIDIGGGSTELIYGGAGTQMTAVDFRKSFDVGSVRLTERFVQAGRFDAPTVEKIHAFLRRTFAEVPEAQRGATVVGVAGTVTTLYAVQHAVEPYDASRIEGGTLSLTELKAQRQRLCALPLEERRRLPGMQPKRADVIPSGALILEAALEHLGVDSCRVSDRGLRWGLLAARFGGVQG